MKIIGFNFTKISAVKEIEFSSRSITNHIDFTNVEKEKIALFQEEQALKISFHYIMAYSDKENLKEVSSEDKKAEVVLEGQILLAVSSDEIKEFIKAWKKKEVPQEFTVPLYNFIFRKCGAKSILLQDDLGLPSPFLKVPQTRRAEK